ncbi:hypothetical protein [Paramaledivibacter caminithermalis]|jgi:hypothetical protein|uniref:Uncharacterized protein n=1 Tax=Paramaledivibacter caminithermalis (strain DSM 15212 / CIP 107654 / DViRD3) TaxID=1121301 RepID=A0A1M6SH07_PARC5|nr:hypothetical protein [Paramaledivibacter caminithermalis]SHK43778.1 hypothetical protein SAMN02745912_03304 [Paramaledivibacter caminithermalis DSM 15212]
MRKYRYVKSEASQHDMKLVQLGAKVEQINSKMCYVKFDIEGFELAYVYNINKKGKYFLERIKPYPLPMREFKSESDVINIIKIDLEQFKNAVNSRNIDAFVTISTELNRTIKQFEDLFLYYNVPKIETQIIMGKISEIQKEIANTKENSERVYFTKDPDNL